MLQWFVSCLGSSSRISHCRHTQQPHQCLFTRIGGDSLKQSNEIYPIQPPAQFWASAGCLHGEETVECRRSQVVARLPPALASGLDAMGLSCLALFLLGLGGCVAAPLFAAMDGTGNNLLDARRGAKDSRFEDSFDDRCAFCHLASISMGHTTQRMCVNSFDQNRCRGDWLSRRFSRRLGLSFYADGISSVDTTLPPPRTVSNTLFGQPPFRYNS